MNYTLYCCVRTKNRTTICNFIPDHAGGDLSNVVLPGVVVVRGVGSQRPRNLTRRPKRNSTGSGFRIYLGLVSKRCATAVDREPT